MLSFESSQDERNPRCTRQPEQGAKALKSMLMLPIQLLRDVEPRYDRTISLFVSSTATKPVASATPRLGVLLALTVSALETADSLLELQNRCSTSIMDVGAVPAGAADAAFQVVIAFAVRGCCILFVKTEL